MFKTTAFVAFAIMALGLQSCSSEENAVSAPVETQNAKSLAPEVVAFKKEVINLIKQKSDSQNKAAIEDKAVVFQNGLTAASKEFLLASGVSENELQTVSVEEAKALRTRALKLLAEKIKTTVNN